ncbi:MAG TPA: hypothetical protein VHN37_01820 [Actinomycetota bacterium]|nr:hypothetical protein [Actinomycetota bacterium]
MGSGRKARVLLLTALAAAIAGGAAAGPRPEASAQPDKSANVRLVEHFAASGYGEGSDLDFDGRRVYAAYFPRGRGAGGIRILDARSARPRELGFVRCPGYQNDVATVRKGLVALGYHSSQCGPSRHGLRLIDVSNPRRPRFLGSVSIPGGGTHTITAYPGKPLIYASPGGFSSERAWRTEYVVDVSNPRRPRIAARFDPVTAGCHDVTFHFERGRKLAFCAGDEETQIWDVASPLKPEIVGRIDNPAIEFHHSVAVTSDGELAVVGDESGKSNCAGGPTGAIFAYDVSDPAAPEERGWFAIPRGPTTDPLTLVGDYGCTAHNFEFLRGTRLLAAAWYWGGMDVVDWSDPDAPEEVAHYRSPRTNYWSAYWHRGRIYANGRFGTDVFSVGGL